MSVINIDVETELGLFDVETKFNDYIGMQKAILNILRNEGFFDSNVVVNKHGGNHRFAYFMTPVKMNDEEVYVKESVRKSLQTNKFWIHNVIIEKSPETLNPNHC